MSFFGKIAAFLKRGETSVKTQEVGVKSGSKYFEYQSPWSRFANKKKLWDDLHDMDTEEPIVARGLDNIAGLVTISDDDNITGFNIEGGDRELAALEPLVVNSNLKGQSFDLVRSMVLNGDHFLELVADERMLIARVKQFPYSWQMDVNWDEYGNLCNGNPNTAMLGYASTMAYRGTPPAYTQKNSIGQSVAAFYPHQIVQMSFGFKGGLQYAEPLLACATPIWKRLRAKEDGLAAARLSRAYSQRIQRVPMPLGTTRDAVQNNLIEYREGISKDIVASYDSINTQFDMVSSEVPPSVDTDYYLPRMYTPDGSKVVDGDIENLEADNPHLTDIEDIYLDIRRLICAMGVPSKYLNLDVGQKAFLDKSSEEAREAFAYLILRVTRVYRSTLKQIFDLQLLLSGINPLTADYQIITPTSLPPSATRTAAQIDTLRSQTAMMWAKLGMPVEVIGSRALRLTAGELDQWMKATGGKVSTEGLDVWMEHARKQWGNGDDEPS